MCILNSRGRTDQFDNIVCTIVPLYLCYTYIYGILVYYIYMVVYIIIVYYIWYIIY